MASLWISFGEGLAIKGFGDVNSRLSVVGAPVEALAEGVLGTAIKSTGYFFPLFNVPRSKVPVDQFPPMIAFQNCEESCAKFLDPGACGLAQKFYTI